MLVYGEEPPPAASPSSDDAKRPPRPRRKRRRKKRPTSGAGAAAPSSVFEADGPVKKRKRRAERKDPDEADVDEPDEEPESDEEPVPPPWWTPWLDPVALLWLPVLAPVLAATSGSAIIGLLLPEIQGMHGSARAGVLITILGSLLFLPVFAFLLCHFTEILIDWSMGERLDPKWDNLDLFESFRYVLLWSCCAASGVLVAAPFALFAYAWSDGGSASVVRLLWGISTVVFCVQFLLALLAVSLFQDGMACNPLLTGKAVVRLSSRLLLFCVELAVHSGVHAAFFIGLTSLWNKDWTIGIILYVLWWAIGILSISRLMRALGLLYRSRAEQLGWFRGEESAA